MSASAARLYRLPSSSHRNTAAGVFVSSIVAVIGGLVLVLWTATQWAARELGYQPALGPPLFAPALAFRPWLIAAALAAAASGMTCLADARTRRLSPALLLLALLSAVFAAGPVYAPWDFFVWELRYGQIAGTEGIWRTGHWLIGVPAHLIFLVGLVLAMRRARKVGGRTDSHGSARWAEAHEIEATGLLQPAGVYVGGWSHRGRTLPLRHDGPQHVLGFAPARSGKGVGWVLPTLLSWPHSVLVNDIKGENWALTSGWRQRALGSMCLKFDPTCDDGSAARPVSLYLTVPPSDLSRARPLVRLLINQIGRRLTERMDFDDGRQTPHYRHRLLLLLDEFAALGRLDFFQTQLSYLPGYGIKAFLIVQDLSQLYAAYGRDESIVSNCDVRVAYAPNKVETARLLSDMAGAMTVHKETRTYTGNRLNPVLMHVLASEQESQRPLLTPDEALRLPPDAALVFVSGSRPILGRKLHYFRDPRFAARARIPAPACADRLSHTSCDWHWAEAASVPQPCTDETAAPDHRAADAPPTTGDITNPPPEQPEAADGVEPFKELLKRSRPDDASEDAEAKT